MINFSRYSNYQQDTSLTEAVGANTSTGQIKLPRHISFWESKSHQHIGKPNKIEQPSKTCSLDARLSPATNLAVNIFRYQLKDIASRQKHLENVHGNLEYRLEVAQARRNWQLVRILQEEFKQLEPSSLEHR